MKIEELNPFIRYAAMHENYIPSKEISVCYDCRLFCVLQGEGRFSVGGKDYRLSPGSCVFLPPKSLYIFSLSSKIEPKIYTLNFDLTDKFSHISHSLGTATEASFLPERMPLYALPAEFSQPIIKQNGISIRNSAEECVGLFLRKTAYYKHSASAHLKLALLELLRESRSERSDYRLVESVQDYVRENYGDPELCNQRISEQFNYHPYHLNRLMKAHTQKTLHDYLIDYRLHMARIYLRTTNLNITAIAERVGFSSYTYFIKLFRERTGVAPLQYRKEWRSIGF